MQSVAYKVKLNFKLDMFIEIIVNMQQIKIFPCARVLNNLLNQKNSNGFDSVGNFRLTLQ